MKVNHFRKETRVEKFKNNRTFYTKSTMWSNLLDIYYCKFSLYGIYVKLNFMIIVLVNVTKN